MSDRSRTWALVVICAAAAMLVALAGSLVGCGVLLGLALLLVDVARGEDLDR